MRYLVRLLVIAVVSLATSSFAAEAKLKAVIIDGQSNHDWRATTPILKKHLEDTNLFTVDVATTPAQGADMSGFAPKFADYRLVVSNYKGDDWPVATRKAFVDYMLAGGGLIVIHAAGNTFPEWAEWNQMIGLSGTGIPEEGPERPFLIYTRDDRHPITIGLPNRWQHPADELSARLRGDPDNIHILSTAFYETATPDIGEHLVAYFTVNFGPGRVFHTTLGHSPTSMKCVGFMFMLQRGAEWAATGQVTQDKVPGDFPTATMPSVRP